MKRIVIIDYGAGNLRSLQKAFQSFGQDAQISGELSDLKQADVLVLPGQGAFASALHNLHQRGIWEFLSEYLKQKRPFLGVCLGFQLLFSRSYENGVHEGLNVFNGEVKHFQGMERQIFVKKADSSLKIPHMGWNSLDVIADKQGFYKGLSKDSYVYFVHSYYVETSDKSIISTTTDYGIDFVSSVQSENLLATQFHPEKSGNVGLKILENFLSKL